MRTSKVKSSNSVSGIATVYVLALHSLMFSLGLAITQVTSVNGHTYLILFGYSSSSYGVISPKPHRTSDKYLVAALLLVLLTGICGALELFLPANWGTPTDVAETILIVALWYSIYSWHQPMQQRARRHGQRAQQVYPAMYSFTDLELRTRPIVHTREAWQSASLHGVGLVPTAYVAPPAPAHTLPSLRTGDVPLTAHLAGLTMYLSCGAATLVWHHPLLGTVTPPTLLIHPYILLPTGNQLVLALSVACGALLHQVTAGGLLYATSAATPLLTARAHLTLLVGSGHSIPRQPYVSCTPDLLLHTTGWGLL